MASTRATWRSSTAQSAGGGGGGCAGGGAGGRFLSTSGAGTSAAGRNPAGSTPSESHTVETPAWRMQSVQIMGRTGRSRSSGVSTAAPRQFPPAPRSTKPPGRNWHR